MTRKIRLGCISCWRDDFDGIDSLPGDWEDIDEVQSYEDSMREVRPDESDADITFWETHLGVCPDCRGSATPGDVECAASHIVPLTVRGCQSSGHPAAARTS